MSAVAKTPLYDAHVALGARMVEFAGFSMPVQYKGLVQEHTAVRTAAGLFDVSHMGEVFVRGPGALAAVEHLVPTNVSRLQIGGALYSMFLRPSGGIVDDVIVYRTGDAEFMLVVNASNRHKDVDWCKEHLLPRCELVDESDAYGLLALQGPKAAEILRRVAPAELAGLQGFTSDLAEIAGVRCRVARTGYTGEDGFEIFTPAAGTVAVWNALLQAGAPFGLEPAGLGARDTLRTEMKYSLYGNDIDDTTSPLEAGLGWVVKMEKGEFLGHGALLRQKTEGLRRKLVGFEMLEPGIPRHGYTLLDGPGGATIGVVTSGTHSPTLNRPIGIGYVPTEKSAIGTELAVEIRGQARRVRVCKTPFYQRAA